MSERPVLDRDHVVSLQGNPYATYAARLDAAHQQGIKSLEVTPLQIPTVENQMTAICQARLEMEDGRIFIDVADASPANCGKNTQNAVLRMSSTRSKARVLGDAINVGDLMDDEGAQPGEPVTAYRPSAPESGGVSEPAPSDGGLVCSHPGCGRPLTQAQAELSRHKMKGALLCLNHQRISERPAA